MMPIAQISPLALIGRDSSGYFNEFDQHQNIIITKIGPVTYNTQTGIHRLQLCVCSDTQVSLHNLRECSETPKISLHPIFTFTPILIFYLQVIIKKTSFKYTIFLVILGKVICFFLIILKEEVHLKQNDCSRISSSSRVSWALFTHSQLTRASSVIRTTVSFTTS